MAELEQPANIEQTLKKVVKQIVKNVEKAAEDIKEEIIGESNIKKIKKRRKEEKPLKKQEIIKEEKQDETEKKTKQKKSEATPIFSAEEQNVFDIYNIADIQIDDLGLKSSINLDFKIVLKSHGRNREKFGKANVNIIERLINLIGVPGHRGKKHKLVTGWASGKYNKNAGMVLEAFKIIEEKTKKNPIQVLVSAIEKSAPRDEVTMIEYGGARYPQAVDCSPLRRVSLALRNIAHGSYDKSFRSKKSFSQCLADEIISTANGENASVAIIKKSEIEKQADSAR